VIFTVAGVLEGRNVLQIREVLVVAAVLSNHMLTA
jgi:hypothetical protein